MCLQSRYSATYLAMAYGNIEVQEVFNGLYIRSLTPFRRKLY